ncbi:MAG TPA: 4-carboxy-4-hydroxy-2-oxoadipate aldolase/oxaloacetate decarboxylase [Alphaproteobacteria bacterium]|jgi:4-hydroxy-4-methyl-2-oxoglutarate aldolase
MSNANDAALLKRLAAHSSATVYEAQGKRGALPSGIKPIHSSMKVCGPALTVDSPPMDNLLLHEAIYKAKPGDVLVVRVAGHYEAGYWGDIMTVAAKERGIAGLIIDGCVRDSQELIEMQFPAFTRGLCIRGTLKHGGGPIGGSVTIGDVTIHTGDLVLGDADGVAIVPQAELADSIAKSDARVAFEDGIKDGLRAGKTTLELYNGFGKK